MEPNWSFCNSSLLVYYLNVLSQNKFGNNKSSQNLLRENYIKSRFKIMLLKFFFSSLTD